MPQHQGQTEPRYLSANTTGPATGSVKPRPFPKSSSVSRKESSVAIIWARALPSACMSDHSAAARQRHQGRNHPPGARVDRSRDAATAIGAAEARARRRKDRWRHAAAARASLPELRRQHGDHRDLRGRLHTAQPPDRAGADEGRHVMMRFKLFSPVSAGHLRCGSTAGHDSPRPRHDLDTRQAARPADGRAIVHAVDTQEVFNQPVGARSERPCPRLRRHAERSVPANSP